MYPTACYCSDSLDTVWTETLVKSLSKLGWVLFYVHRNHRLIVRDGSPGWPPRLLHSSWALIYLSAPALAAYKLRACLKWCQWDASQKPSSFHRRAAKQILQDQSLSTMEILAKLNILLYIRSLNWTSDWSCSKWTLARHPHVIFYQAFVWTCLYKRWRCQQSSKHWTSDKNSTKTRSVSLSFFTVFHRLSVV